MTDQTSPLAVIVLSGGMDSTTALALMLEHGYRTVALSVDYGQRHRRELRSAAAVATWYRIEHLTVDLSSVGAVLPGSALTDPAVLVPEGHYAEETMRATIVPNRNALLASVAVALAIARHAELVVMGMHAGDHAIYPDCRPEFLTALQDLVDVANEGQQPPRVIAPFLGMSKTYVAATAARLRVPLDLTWSCYQGGDRHCGVCGTCYERREAFRDAAIPDPTVYADSTTTFPAPELTP